MKRTATKKSTATPSYMRPKTATQTKEELQPRRTAAGKPEARLPSTPADPVLERSFRGHKDTITSVGFNPNLYPLSIRITPFSKQVISGSLDGTVTVWNFSSQLRPFRFIGHKLGINEISVHPSGTMIASASSDATVRLWSNTVEGRSQILKAHNAPVKTVNFSCDGALLLTGSDDKTLKVYTVLDRKFQYSINAHSNWVRSAQFSPDARMIVSGSDDRTVRLWDVASKSLVHTYSDHEGIIHSVRFHPDGTCIASGSYDRTIKVSAEISCRVDLGHPEQATPATLRRTRRAGDRSGLPSFGQIPSVFFIRRHAQGLIRVMNT